MSVLNKILIAVAILSLFAGTTVLNTFGYLHAAPQAPFYFKLHPATYLILIASLYYYIEEHEKLSIKKSTWLEIITISFIFLMLVYLIVDNRANSIAFILDTILCPILISFLLKKKLRLQQKLFKVVVFFFVSNSLLSIIEKQLDFNFFPVVYNFGGYFRATALQGHPLNNALITSVIMSFIIVSNWKSIYKYSSLFLGYVSLLCYGARGALIITSLALTLYFLYNILFGKNKASIGKSVLNSTFIIFSFLSLYYLLFETSFGERILAVSSFDTQGEGRLEALLVLYDLNLNQILWGASQSQIDHLLEFIDVGIIENFWILWILKFGLILTVVLTILLISILFKILNPLEKAKRIFLIAVFLGVASTNNSLATSTTAMTIFVLCAYSFFAQEKVKAKYVILLKKLHLESYT